MQNTVINIIFKAIEQCNSDCAYCNVIKNKPAGQLSFDLLEILFLKINEFLEINPHKTIVLTWHGGEPCLLGVDYFHKALKFQNTHCQVTKSRIKHAVQSNLTLINQDFLDIFKLMGISQIGTSYEPIPNIRRLAKNRDSDMYNKKFLSGIRLLENNHFSWGIIYVVNKQSIKNPVDLFLNLSNLQLKRKLVINPAEIYHDNNENMAITPIEYAQFLGKIFPIWWKYKHRYTNVEPFCSMVENITNNSERLTCSDSGNCAYRYAYIGPRGETSHCGRSNDLGVISYGNIQERSLNDIFNDEHRKQFVERDKMLPQTDCNGCRFWTICHGGCPVSAYNQYGAFNHKTEWCDAKKVFIEEYFEPITGLSVKK